MPPRNGRRAAKPATAAATTSTRPARKASPPAPRPTKEASSKVAKRAQNTSQKVAKKAISNPSSKSVASFWESDILIASTATRIISWGAEGLSKLYKSKEHGIEYAAAARDGSCIAIAGSDVVVIKKINDKDPILYHTNPPDEDDERRPIQMKFSKDGQLLFMTHRFKPSIAVYSQATKKVEYCGEYSQPYEISSFSVSQDPQKILTVQSKNGCVKVENWGIDKRELENIDVMPPGYHEDKFPPSTRCSPVTCAVHPVRGNIFAVGREDGSIAAYDSNKLSQGPTISSKKAAALSCIENLHGSPTDDAGVVAIEFLPCPGAKAVTVGKDRRMCFVDFEQGKALNSWMLPAPASALCIKSYGSSNGEFQWAAAVGMVDGKCNIYAYDQGLNMVADRQLSREGEMIHSLEWTAGKFGTSPEIEFDRKSAKDAPYLYHSDRLPISRAEHPPVPAPKPTKQSNTAKSSSKKEALAPAAFPFPMTSSKGQTDHNDYMDAFSPIKVDAPRRSARLSSSNVNTSPGTSSTPQRSAASLVAPKSKKRPELDDAGLVPTVSAPQLSSSLANFAQNVSLTIDGASEQPAIGGHHTGDRVPSSQNKQVPKIRGKEEAKKSNGSYSTLQAISGFIKDGIIKRPQAKTAESDKENGTPTIGQDLLSRIASGSGRGGGMTVDSEGTLENSSKTTAPSARAGRTRVPGLSAKSSSSSSKGKKRGVEETDSAAVAGDSKRRRTPPPAEDQPVLLQSSFPGLSRNGSKNSLATSTHFQQQDEPRDGKTAAQNKRGNLKTLHETMAKEDFQSQLKGLEESFRTQAQHMREGARDDLNELKIFFSQQLLNQEKKRKEDLDKFKSGMVEELSTMQAQVQAIQDQINPVNGVPLQMQLQVIHNQVNSIDGDALQTRLDGIQKLIVDVRERLAPTSKGKK